MFGTQPALSFRSAASADSEQEIGFTTRIKLLELMPQSDSSEEVALLVALMPSNSPQVDIWIKLCPTIGIPHLPEDLEIKVLDKQKIVVMQAQSRQTDMLQLKFRGKLGERFSIEVTLNEVSLVETFVI